MIKLRSNLTQVGLFTSNTHTRNDAVVNGHGKQQQQQRDLLNDNEHSPVKSSAAPASTRCAVRHYKEGHLSHDQDQRQEEEDAAEAAQVECMCDKQQEMHMKSNKNVKSVMMNNDAPGSDIPPRLKKIKTAVGPKVLGDRMKPSSVNIVSYASTPQKIKPSTINTAASQPSDYLPPHLRRYVQHSHGDFFVSASFEPRLIAQLMFEGFLPIATPRYLVPKLHKERCVIYPLNQYCATPCGEESTMSSPGKNHVMNQDNHSAVHISKNVRKRAKKFCMTMNQAFDQVVEGCHDQHGIGWLYTPIVEAFRVIHQGSIGNEFNSFPVRLYSVEVWNAATGNLAGGELGFAVGTMYTSLTGFAKEDSAGSVQLAALGQYLWGCGFDLWDFGMTLDYKSKLGAEAMSRDDFVQKVRELRGKRMGLMRMDAPRCCKSIITDVQRGNV